MDTIFWQKRIRPLLQPGAPAFFLLDSGTAWQREALACLQDAWQAVADEPPDYENEARYRLTTVLRLLGAQCEEGGGVKVSQQEQIAAERMKQMLRFVEEHYAEELTVERIAACVALSESACLRSFRQMLGITPIQYVKQYRVEKAAELAKAAGARRALRLPVGGAFHSPLMEPAKPELEKAIAEAPFQTPVCPVYQNVDAKPYTDPAAIKANLIAQLTAPVRWTYIVRNMLSDGVTEFTELGPGSVLQGLIRKVDPNTVVESKSTL